MTRRHDLEMHRQSLDEIGKIMNSMKTLAYMETRKLGRFLDAQHAVIRSIESAAIDLLSSFPNLKAETGRAMSVYLLIGSERGFCGDINQALLNHFNATVQTTPNDQAMRIVIGRKLHTLMQNDSRGNIFINGASVAEDIPDLLNVIVEQLMAIQKDHGDIQLNCLHHTDRTHISAKKLLPPFMTLVDKSNQQHIPVILNLSPQQLLAELSEHYLFAALHEMLYTSLSAENSNRISHLEGAVKHLSDKSEQLMRQCNTLRQEEIIEEIEVILLNASTQNEFNKTRSHS